MLSKIKDFLLNGEIVFVTIAILSGIMGFACVYMAIVDFPSFIDMILSILLMISFVAAVTTLIYFVREIVLVFSNKKEKIK